MLRVNKQKCMGCGACIDNCPGATQMESDGKAKVVDQEKLEKCGGERVCGIGAIEKVPGGKESGQQTLSTPPLSLSLSSYGTPPSGGRGLGRGRGPGWSRGRGRKWRGGRS